MFPLLVALIWGLAWLIPYLILKGNVIESEYGSATHAYKLPFPGGESSWGRWRKRAFGSWRRTSGAII